MQYPSLDSTPCRYPQCCASLSTGLIDLLHQVLPPPSSLTLSVGSGSGLLEACLIAQHPDRASSLKCVEVRSDPPVNVFFPDDGMIEVLGTWDVPDIAAEAVGLLFVYPRQSSLVRSYLAQAKKLTTAVWIGPRCDVEDFKPALDSWGSLSPTPDAVEAVCDPGEDIMVFRR